LAPSRKGGQRTSFRPKLGHSANMSNFEQTTNT
jgi:hypothetical protein